MKYALDERLSCAIRRESLLSDLEAELKTLLEKKSVQQQSCLVVISEPAIMKPLSSCSRMSISNEAFALEIEREFDQRALDCQPWLPKSEAAQREQELLQDLLKRKAGAKFAPRAFVARGARILTQKFVLGDSSWVADGAIIRGDVTIGANSSINANCHIAGIVRIGNGVRIAGMVSIYGFNHGYDRTDIPIYAQPHTYQGVEIGDGTWIGANAVIVDGCKIGAHCVVAAGAVVTKSFPDYQIIGGNPARIIRDRIQVSRSDKF